ncbi:copine-5-like isoform X4 [Leptotrombidium deliense]|uniref:Copine-5-like isoform X4 n=1 Tax=Leptotrombidium deliense TaxID=299467 RepID=A0A443STG1_9ACAR|nr:copine-5-like isoform X4 [Leptotrombidium deliense]
MPNLGAVAATGGNNLGIDSIFPTTQVEISISCRDLLDCDILSKSDPQVVVYMKDSFGDQYYEVGKTEVIYDNLNPNFIKKFIVNYNFEVVQQMKFEVWDIDMSGRDFLGHCETTLADIVANKGRQFKRSLTGVSGKNCGDIIIVVEELSSCKQIVYFQFKALQLKKPVWFLKPDPFLMLWRSNEDGSYSVVHKTETCKATQYPMWQMTKIQVRTFCNGDFDRSVRVDCLDYRHNGNHKLIGSCYTTLNKLVNEPLDKNKYELSNPMRNPIKTYGKLELVQVNLKEETSFLDYIRGGLEMHFAVAIDFTASNGDVSDPKSHHFIDLYTGRQNAYEIALRAVGEIIQHYDTQGMFPGFGFGAKVPPSNRVSHQFPLNGNQQHPYCKGVDELIACYRQSVNAVTLSGPTNFAPVINSTAAIAKEHQNGTRYFILLIITDGIICDMQQTKHAIIIASHLPMSIIIVGVGNADFSAMDELDSDDVILNVDGHNAARDIVQFVPINRYLSRDGSSIRSQVELAREVLYEVPDQIVSYMVSKGFKPKKASMTSN